MTKASLPRATLLLPFIDHPAQAVACEARRLDPKRIRISDLPLHATQVERIEGLEFESLTHLANLSSIPASLVLGHVLRESQ